MDFAKMNGIGYVSLMKYNGLISTCRSVTRIHGGASKMCDGVCQSVFAM